MLITKTVKVKWNSKIKTHYESLGYIYTKRGDEFEVNVVELTKGSHIEVQCSCDNCGIIFNRTYKNYNKYLKEDNKTYCEECSNKLFGTEKMKKTKLSKSKSFEQYCIEINRMDLILRWDEAKNGCKPNEVCYSSNKLRWFKCLIHPEHESELKNLNSFSRGQERSMDCKQCNSIGQYILDNYGEEFLNKIWSEKNEKSPFEYSVRSSQKVWWNCIENKHEPFKKRVVNIVICNFRCPNCYEPPKGENNPRWNPNLTQEERENGRHIEGYNDFVKGVYKRDNYTCQCCGVKGNGYNLNAHHLNGYHWDKKHRTDVDNGVTLCEECHKEFHHIFGNRNNTKEQFKEFLKLKVSLEPEE